jgi:hypothetical protein
MKCSEYAVVFLVISICDTTSEVSVLAALDTYL